MLKGRGKAQIEHLELARPFRAQRDAEGITAVGAEHIGDQSEAVQPGELACDAGTEGRLALGCVSVPVATGRRRHGCGRGASGR